MEVKIAEVVAANAVVDPWAVVVHAIDALVTHVAVPGLLRLYNLAFRAYHACVKLLKQVLKHLPPARDALIGKALAYGRLFYVLRVRTFLGQSVLVLDFDGEMARVSEACEEE